MVRTYEDPVQVSEQAQEAAGPRAFLWRGRLYVVRSVLGHWYERRAWWAEGAARAVHGQVEVVGDLQGSPGTDREIWRVEASAGRYAGSGVFDLCRGSESPESWRLLRVAD